MTIIEPFHSPSFLDYFGVINNSLRFSFLVINLWYTLQDPGGFFPIIQIIVKVPYTDKSPPAFIQQL